MSLFRPYRRAWPARAALACALLAAFGAAPVHAEDSPYYIGAALSVSRQSNMLGLADGARVPAGYSRDDRITSTSLLGGFNQPFGRQRAYSNFTVKDNRYGNNEVFDNRSYNAVLGLDWATVERLQGNVEATAARSLQRYASTTINITEKNLETVRTIGGTANLGLVTQYGLVVSLNHREVSNSLQRDDVQAREFEQDSATVSARWSPSSISSFTLGLGQTRGRYPKFRTAADGTYSPDRFKRNSVVFSANYRPSGGSSLSLNLSDGSTHYDLNEQRDFSGVTGSLNWVWQASGKLRLTTVMSRDTGQDSYTTMLDQGFGQPSLPATSDYSQTSTTYRVFAELVLTGKTSMTAGAARINRKLVRSITVLPGEDDRGEEGTTRYTLGLRWSPLRSLSVGCDYSNDQRSARGALTAPLHNSGFSCYGQFVLQ